MAIKTPNKSFHLSADASGESVVIGKQNEI